MRRNYIVSLTALLSACTSRCPVTYVSPVVDPVALAAPVDIPAPDPLRAEQWALDTIGTTAGGSATLTVAVLSTGVDYNHEDLRGRIAVNRAELDPLPPGATTQANGVDDDGNGLVDDVVGWDVIDSDGFAYDRRGVGTGIAGIIAAKQNNGLGISGMLSDVRLYPVRYIDDNGAFSDWELVAALRVAAQAKPHVVVVQAFVERFIPAQWETYLSDPDLGEWVRAYGEANRLALKSALDALGDTPIVVGAGNDAGLYGDGEVAQFLRNFPNVYVVTSSTRMDQKAFVANHSPMSVLTAAPGEDVLTTRPFGEYGRVSSTSYAAAHLAGALALAISAGGAQSSAKITSALVSPQGSDRLVSMQTVSVGRNRLNVVKLLSLF